MAEDFLPEIVHNKISKEFGLKKTGRLSEFQFDEFHALLSEAVRATMERDMNLLLNIMYRLDIDEEKFKGAMAQEPSSQVHQKIATLIIEREIEKQKFRKNFGSKRH